MKQTPLHSAHIRLKAKMAEFAGYDMPIQYPEGVMAEHNWTRDHAGIFDVSHMGQLVLEGPGALDLLHRLTPSDFSALRDGAGKYSVLTNEQGGIIDDFIATRLSEERYFLVVNGACKDKDIAWIESHLTDDATLTHLSQRGLIALQGPSSEEVLMQALGIDAGELGYMKLMQAGDLYISRLGYTGEDGFEISMPDAQCGAIWDKLLGHAEVKPVGLAARDSLRLDLGYPLYGHDIDAVTTPLEADLGWIVRKNDAPFIGSDKLSAPRRKRVGIRLTDKGIAREGSEIHAEDGRQIGMLTSGGFSPTLNGAIAMGYVGIDSAAPGTKISISVRGRPIAAEIVPLPFVTARTKARKKHAA